MTRVICIDDFLECRQHLALIDVRSPSEFAQGHIPGAVNVSLFSDEERAEVGRCYKARGRTDAVLLGLELVGPKLRDLVTQVKDVTATDEMLVHCWRGGMRSESVAWLLEQAGLRPRVLEGGYKRYRQQAQVCFKQERPVVVLSGMTGAGKTRLLQQLGEAGEQVIDLEGLANHRGSSFGAIGLPDQPTCEQFENELFEALWAADLSRPVWVEDESPSIGRVRVPQDFWWLMRRSPAIYVDVSRRERAANLAYEYGQLPADELATAIERLESKLGGLRMQQTLELLRQGAVEDVAYELLAYYDKTYQHAAKKRPRERVQSFTHPLEVDRLRALARDFALPATG